MELSSAHSLDTVAHVSQQHESVAWLDDSSVLVGGKYDECVVRLSLQVGMQESTLSVEAVGFLLVSLSELRADRLLVGHLVSVRLCPGLSCGQLLDW